MPDLVRDTKNSAATLRRELGLPLTWTATLVGPLVLSAGFALVLKTAGLLQFSGTEASAHLVAASLALAGVFITVTATVAGLVLKHSVDIRAERRLQLEADRNAALQADTQVRLQLEADRNAAMRAEAENRLKLEASIQAVQLLSTPTGAAPQAIQRAGALFALASLGQYQLTLTLTDQLLDHGELDASAAAGLLSLAMCNPEEEVQRAAVMIFCTHPDSLLIPGGVALPACLEGGYASLSPYGREWCAIGIGRIIIARPRAEWDLAKYSAFSLTAALALGYSDEVSPTLKKESGALLKAVLKAFGGGTLRHPRRWVDLDQLAAEVESVAPQSMMTRELVSQFEAWLIAENHPPHSGDGSA